mgnify:FL=1
MALSDSQGNERKTMRLMNDLDGLKRTCYCGEVREEHVGSRVTLMGWVNRRRDLGDLIFIDLRDRTGLVQIVCDPVRSPHSFDAAKCLRSEYVVCVIGRVVERKPGTENPNIPTGNVEVLADTIRIFNCAKTPPFVVRDEAEPDESIRMKYRYIDLRRLPMMNNLKLRHEIVLAARNYLSANGFWEIETPAMTRSTPEGARDYLVPSRQEPGRFYSLAQSPQLFKQLLMISGVDKYFQICRCFRDEDLRADRQPEFTQIDIELSFTDEEQVYDLVEGMMKHIWKEVLGSDLCVPFPRLTWDEAMERYGSDKPDTRFGMEISDITDVIRDTEFSVFKNAIGAGGTVRAICVPGCAELSRQTLDRLTDKAKEIGAKGLISISYLPDKEIKSPVKKHLTQEEIIGIKQITGAEEGDLVLIVADEFDTAVGVLGRMRKEIAQHLGLIPEEAFDFVWVTEFPLLERNKEEGVWQAAHHPFTSPSTRDLKLLDDLDEQLKGKLRARAYDLVLNGVELASGSIRIHRRDIQEKVFELLDLSLEEAQEKFGFLLDAFEYGAPPHGGIAFGLDRFVMVVAGANTIRDVMAFPKTTSGSCLLTGAPSEVSPDQLKELGLRLIEDNTDHARARINQGKTDSPPEV